MPHPGEERWKTLMKNYLPGKNVWISGSTEEALRIIQPSCGSKIFYEISSCKSTKMAWGSVGF